MFFCYILFIEALVCPPEISDKDALEDVLVQVTGRQWGARGLAGLSQHSLQGQVPGGLLSLLERVSAATAHLSTARDMLCARCSLSSARCCSPARDSSTRPPTKVPARQRSRCT